MSAIESTVENVKQVFEIAQTGSQHKAVLFKVLNKLREKSSAREGFVKDFIHYLKFCMIVFKKEPAVERMIDFIAEYTTKGISVENEKGATSRLSDGSDEDEDSGDSTTNSFLSAILNFLLKVQNAEDKAVRYRACQLISKIFENMDEEATIHEDIAEEILTKMLERVCDKIPVVRCQAVCALSRLQDPLDPNCPVMAAYVYLIASDSSADVRKTVLNNVTITKLTLPHIIARTRDVKDPVRKHAFFVISEKVSIRALSIAQRIQLLQDGLNDHVESVKQTCLSKLVGSWLKSCQNSIIDFLALLDVQNSLETVETTLRELLKGVEGEHLVAFVSMLKDSIETGFTGHTIPFEKLDCERSLYWKCLSEHCSKLGPKGQDAMDALLPEVSGFCEYIQRFIEDHFKSSDGEDNIQHTFILEQLLSIAGFMDLSDEVGRKNFSKLIHELMINPKVPVTLMPVLHKRYINIEADLEVRINQIAEVIADIKEPITLETSQIKEANRVREVKMAGIKVKLNQLRDEMETSVSAQEFEKAAEIKCKIVEIEQERHDLEQEDIALTSSNQTRIEKDDPVTLVRCLSIASELLQGITKTTLNPTLITLVDTLILPGVQNEDPLVRNVALNCLGLCSLLSRDFARRYMVLLLQVVLLDVEQVQITALKAIFDLLQTFGLDAFEVTPAEQAIVEAEESLLDPEGPETDEEDQDDENYDIEDEGEFMQDQGGVKEDGTDNEKTDKIMEEANKSVSSVFFVLIKLLDRENSDIRNVAAEGLAKLLLSGRVHSPKVLSRLLLLWYNPTTEEDVHLRHCLGVFLPAFAFDCRVNQELVEETFLPTLRTLFSAPSSSPLARVDVSNVAELLVQLTCDKYIKNTKLTEQSVENAEVGADSLHGSLALKISNEILSDPEAQGIRILCKTLSHLSLETASKSNLKDLLVLTRTMNKAVEDKRSKKYLNKFHQQLTSLQEAELTTADDKAKGKQRDNKPGESQERTVPGETDSGER